MSNFEKYGRFGIPQFCYSTGFLPYETKPNEGIGFHIQVNGFFAGSNSWGGDKSDNREEFHFFESPLETNLGTSLYGKTKG